MAVACNDGSPVPRDFDSFEEYFEMLNERSEWGEIWAKMRSVCM
jgi:hypothetical protein